MVAEEAPIFVLFQVNCAEEEHGCPKDELERAHLEGGWTHRHTESAKVRRGWTH